MIFLQGSGVSTSLAVKIYKKYGDDSIDTVKQQPYKLAADIWGIGFKTAQITPLIPGLAEDELAVREEIPVAGAAEGSPVRAVYLPPFYHSERSLASALRRLSSTSADRLGAFQSVDWDKALRGSGASCDLRSALFDYA
jgi:exodeoxyribonuclease V alpha subunit